MAKLLYLLTLILVLCLVELQLTSARGMWGAGKKKKQDDDDGSASADVNPMGGFEFSQKRAAAGLTGLGGRGGAGAGDDMISTLTGLLEMYVQSVDALLDSPDFEKLVTPETIMSTLGQIPGMGDIPELAEALNSPELRDPAQLKMLMRQGIGAIKEMAYEFLAGMSDPQQMEEMMSSLPAEVQPILAAVMSGDMGAIKDIIDAIPGVSAEQKMMINNMLDGNMDMDSMMGQFQDQMSEMGDLLMGDEQIEAARQQFLAEPELAQMAGLDTKTLNDPRKFKAFYEETMGALMGGGLDQMDDQLAEGINSRARGASFAA